MAMAAFLNLEDSPMFQKQINYLEQTAEVLRDRCQMLYKGCKKFMGALGEAFIGDKAFADSLEAFGGGQDDPVSMSIGGPLISKFITVFRELATCKELLHSQVEHVLIDRLMHFMTVDLQEAKESRRRFDKAINAYDQAREKFVSLKKSARGEIVAELEEDLQNSKSAFERSRFNLVNDLMNVEAKKKHVFLESLSTIMDAHLRYFKLGYELLSQMEPFIHELLTYAQKSKELANIEQDKLAKRIQEFRTQVELGNLRASTNMEVSSSANGIHVVGMISHKNIEAIMQPTAKGEVKTIRQGYLLKRSSSLRGDWKRRFFVLDNLGTLYYFRNKGTRPLGARTHRTTGSVDNIGGVFGRFRARQHRAIALGEENLGCHTVDLHTSTVKIDAEDIDLRLCFRIFSPSKTYTLQTENEADRMDWVNKITGVIESLLNSHFLQLPNTKLKENNHPANAATFDDGVLDSEQNLNDMKVNEADCVTRTLREIPGNDLCAECNAPNPEWASLNLGISLCIECSGVHRNLGVHISKVRSMKLDVKVWEHTILDLFRSLGNSYCNSVWEELLQLQIREDESIASSQPIMKPSPKDSIHVKEKYIQAKYVEKLFAPKAAALSGISSHSSIWKAVEADDLREVYRLIVTCNTNITNTSYDRVVGVNLCHHVETEDSQLGCDVVDKKQNDPTASTRTNDSNDPEDCLQGSSLLHLACLNGNPVMLELLLQFGADINMCDYHGRTPLHQCIYKGNNQLAKFLLKRGARPSIKDGGGLSALEIAMEMGAITDEELFILLAESH